MSKKNFLLGKGERLTEVVTVPSGGGDKAAPYTFAEAKQRLQPMLKKTIDEIDALPQNACPDNIVVATITLNPEYIAKSYYPGDLLKAIGLETVGSRAKKLTPAKRSKQRQPEETVTTELFVMANREIFRKWVSDFDYWNENSPGANQIITVEEIAFPTASEKLRNIETQKGSSVYEVVLHLDEIDGEKHFLSNFKSYLESLGIEASLERRFYAGGLCFLELSAPSGIAEDIAKYSLVRVLRTMPKLRLLRPTVRTTGADHGNFPDLPDEEPLDPTLKVAIFDGGIPDGHPLTRWATTYDAPGVGSEETELLEHGVSVTSAFLFGHIDPRTPLERPYSYVDHYRVLDNVPGQNPFELYEVLDRIMNVLETNNYDFLNLSLGPYLPIDDLEVHAWTALLDTHLCDGTTLATIAVGNDGEGDPSIQANRIQVPSDCVNALAIGACDSPDAIWQRASYSSIGPGRSPGLVKPDLVDFGGSMQRPFLTLSMDGTKIIATGGTSFAAPSTLRIGTGVRAHFGSALNALAIRTLLVHCADSSTLPRFEVGFGRVSRSLSDIVICNDDEMRVVFQGRITASKYLRAPVPMPLATLKGMVKIKATLCYATPVDPHHPDNYTRSGLEVTFRPHKDKKRKTAPGEAEPMHAISKNFFGKTRQSYQTEEEQRKDSWKWENCLHGEIKMQGSSLKDSVFDIHFNARSEGHNDSKGQEIEYALVISLTAPKNKEVYDQVVRRYATQLEQLQPVIDIPLRT
jgi:hypothetical protein